MALAAADRVRRTQPRTPGRRASSAHAIGTSASSYPVGRVVARPGRNLLRVLDDLAVVEHKHRDEALAGQPLDLPAPARYVRHLRKAIDLDDLRRMAGVLQCVVRDL